VSLKAGPDVAGLKHLQLALRLPAGLKAGDLPMDADFRQAERKVSWSLSPRQKTLQRFLKSLVKAGGWEHPEMALGGFKEHKDKPYGIARPDTFEWQFLQGGRFQSGLTGWFRMDETGIQDGPEAPVIVGVVFHSQVLPRGIVMEDMDAMDGILFNYSVDGSTQGLLATAPDLNTLAKDDYFTDCYYDASLDRAWTWKDLNNLRVSFRALQRGDRKTDNVLASCDVTVATLNPKDMGRELDLEVTEPRCRTLALEGLLLDEDSGAQARQVLNLPVNAKLCAGALPTASVPPPPTPLPTQTPTLRPTVVLVQASPAPSATVLPSLEVTPGALGLGKLLSSPEPFARGGVILYFDLAKPAVISLTVLHAGKVLRSLKAGTYQAGSNQLFFNGLDDSNHTLKPGLYDYQLNASAGDLGEVAAGHFTRAPDPPVNP
jgi:hypothetical protein